MKKNLDGRLTVTSEYEEKEINKEMNKGEEEI